MPDVVVIGGGPAGAATAILCTRAGLEVTLLERHATAVHKTGETLHPGVEPLLEQLGVAEAVRAARFLRHDGIEVAWDGTAHFERYGSDANGPWRGFQASRATFDRLLLAAAEASGGSVRRGLGVREVRRAGARAAVLDTDDGPFATRWIVDASGAAHWLARRLGLRPERLTPRLLCWYGYVRRAAGDPPRLRGDRTGWTWTAEVEPGLYQWTRLALDGARPAAAPLAGERVGRQRAADVTWRWVPRCAEPGYVLVGDAAAVLDPSSSHGILRALMTGIRAAQLIVASERDRRLAPLACRQYGHWLGDWVRHDAAEMRRLYRRLPSPPRWAGAA